MTTKHVTAIGLAVAALALGSGLVWAAGQYGPGASDTEIKIGQTMPYSGPASAYGTIGKAESAYFAMINDKGGVNGRKINLISRDDGYSPPKTVEAVRKLVEEDQVLLTFNVLGTPPNTAVQGYLNDNKVPQLFVATGADKWNNPKQFPWTMGWQPSYRIEARIYGRYILKNFPNAKVAIVYQNDDFGKDYLTGLKEGLGDKAGKMLVATQSYETTDPTIDSQVVALQGSGADTLLVAAIPKFAAQAIRKVSDLGWKPHFFITNVSASVKAVMQPAGLDKSQGIITAGYLKDPNDPQWQNSTEYKDWLAWMKKYYAGGSLADVNNVYGYSVAETLVSVLKASGNNLTRANIMKQAASIHDLKLPMMLPGIVVSTSATNFAPIKQMQLQKFEGQTWKLFGNVMSGSGS
ncbi:MAG: ABC transporter substrate-binding protein [Hyphomicrobiales bacterium]|nr:ABC transporter substrate-binding protein [Hyphomicrobiales bacterium]MDE2283048.1 ABC transporter substrate-binding protein [Hyphomicrobiales bacterium]